MASECKHCGCDDAGTKIYQCDEGHVFCGVCGGMENIMFVPVPFGATTCPICGGNGSYLGKISDDDDE